jgi:hypothetical protein
MGKKKNVYNADSYLITLGIVAIIVSAISIFADPRTYFDVLVDFGHGSFTFADREGRTDEEILAAHEGARSISNIEFPLTRVIIGANGFLLLLIGFIIRAKENKIIALWDALERAKEIRIRDLEMSLGTTREFISKNLKTINAQPGVYFVYDSQSDKIIDGRLLTEFVISADCKGCGNKVSEKISLQISQPPKCGYCGNAISAEELNQLKQEALKETEQATAASGNFNVGIFIVLFIIFWPGAIAYLIVKKSGSMKQFADKYNQLSVEMAERQIKAHNQSKIN